MQTESSSASRDALAELQREQNRLRLRLAIVLLSAVSVFALFISWLGRTDPLNPLLMVKTSLFALLAVYAVGIGVAWVYARWIRVRREPAVRNFLAKERQ